MHVFSTDTLKTRMQSAEGFWKSGGFRGIYRGLSAAAAGSVPGSALYFGAYDTCKRILGADNGDKSSTLAIASASIIGETVNINDSDCACLYRWHELALFVR